MCAAPFDFDPGQGQGSRVFHSFDGYSYHQNNSVISEDGQYATIYVRCTQFSRSLCPGRAIIQVMPDDLEWVNTQPHTCQPDLRAPEARQFRHEVLEACRNELYVPPRQLFNTVSERYTPEVVARFGPTNLKTSMRTARLGQYPKAPETLVELGRLLERPEYGHLTATIGGEDSVYCGVVGFPGSECLLFMSRRNRKYLSKAREAFADATFVPAPVKPLAAQVYQIVCLAGNNVIAIAQILMPNKEYPTYLGMLEGFKRHVPKFRPRTVHMDYERNPIKAWRAVYKRVKIRGCYFHYVKADLKKVKKLGLTNLIEMDHEVRSMLRSFLSIPLLPHEMMHRALFMLIKRAVRHPQWEALEPFFTYYISTWMVGFRYDTLSVYGEPNRTNNASEAAQRNLRKETGPHHPNIWEFINAIRRYEWAAYISVRRARRGQAVGRRQKTSTLRNDAVIRNATAYLMAGEWSIKRFLKVTSTRVLNVFHDSLRLRGLI